MLFDGLLDVGIICKCVLLLELVVYSLFVDLLVLIVYVDYFVLCRLLR